eukprot:CAMPEP_0170525558 /NCGR_PEP_ID=MMETSP0209-20121228/10999_1 /TAXON_ID=665100 ORGANISM="Litonotus pictus, Strain P1" /NCGR_SAMPLE_ID=MMETSP0209 /ASSEMBLY_ACC=CAM_ASM_000301 /LENGTH=845 /DNA_ID=CAMNT_0010814851 /DNA_START=80 /DNA_END=2620 /DNA_ORIENTATION=-
MTINTYLKNQQTTLNSNLLSINEELEALKEGNNEDFTKSSPRNKTRNNKGIGIEETQDLSEKQRLKENRILFREVGEDDSKQKAIEDEDMKIIYSSLERILNQCFEKTQNVCYDYFPRKEQVVHLDFKCFSVTFLESAIDLKFPNNIRVQTFRLIPEIVIDDFIKGSLDFWELSKDYSRYDYYGVDQQNQLRFIHEKDYETPVENYLKTLGRIKFAKFYIVMKSQYKNFVDIYQETENSHASTEVNQFIREDKSKNKEIFIEYFSGIQEDIHKRIDQRNEERRFKKENSKEKGKSLKMLTKDTSVLEYFIPLFMILLLVCVSVSLFGSFTNKSLYENIYLESGFYRAPESEYNSKLNNTQTMDFLHLFYNNSKSILNFSPMRFSFYFAKEEECEPSNSISYQEGKTCSSFRLSKDSEYFHVSFSQTEFDDIFYKTAKFGDGKDYVNIKIDLSNYITSTETLYNSISSKYSELYTPTTDHFSSNYYFYNQYGSLANTVSFNPIVESFDFMKLFFDIINQVPLFNNERLRAMIIDFNIFSLENNVIKNYQLIQEFNPAGPSHKAVINYLHMMDGFYSMDGRLITEVLDILRLVIYALCLIFVVKRLLDQTRFSKTFTEFMGVFFTVKYLFAIVIPIIGFISVIVKLISFNNNLDSYASIEEGQNSIVRSMIKINTNKFLLYNDIQILESVEVCLLIIVIVERSTSFASQRALHFYTFMRMAFIELGALLMGTFLICCVIAMVGEKVFGGKDTHFIDFWNSLIRVLCAACGYIYTPVDPNSSNEVAFYSIVIYFFLVFLAHNFLIGFTYNTYRNSLLLNECELKHKKIKVDEDGIFGKGANPKEVKLK